MSGPVKSKGIDATKRQLDCFKAAIAQSGVTIDEAFVPALAPGWLDHFIYNEYYKTDEEFVYALADAMSDKYRAIADAGYILQLDDPGIATSWDMLKPEPSMADYRKYIAIRIEALNHALKGIAPEQVRYHFCWGSWHGAHVNDIPLKHIIDLALKVNAQTISFEAANVRHEHEIAVWKEQKLAPGRMLMPGVISHATNIVEHPELVARRLTEYAAFAGRENVIAGADCGMGGRVHAEIGWAKLAALAEGAAIASKTLVGKESGMSAKSVMQRMDEVVDAYCKSNRYQQEELTPGRARTFVRQHRLNTRQRNSVLKLRVATNCPDFETRLKVLKACSQEVIADNEFAGGKPHWQIIEDLGVSIGMNADEIRAAKPLPSTEIAWAAWDGLMSQKHWLLGVVGNSCAERANVPGYGNGLAREHGNSHVQGKRWEKLFGLKGGQLEFFEVHCGRRHRPLEPRLARLRRACRGARHGGRGDPLPRDQPQGLAALLARHLRRRRPAGRLTGAPKKPSPARGRGCRQKGGG